MRIWQQSNCRPLQNNPELNILQILTGLLKVMIQSLLLKVCKDAIY